jgi:hypothetical protein
MKKRSNQKERRERKGQGIIREELQNNRTVSRKKKRKIRKKVKLNRGKGKEKW